MGIAAVEPVAGGLFPEHAADDVAEAEGDEEDEEDEDEVDDVAGEHAAAGGGAGGGGGGGGGGGNGVGSSAGIGSAAPDLSPLSLALCGSTELAALPLSWRLEALMRVACGAAGARDSVGDRWSAATLWRVVRSGRLGRSLAALVPGAAGATVAGGAAAAAADRAAAGRSQAWSEPDFSSGFRGFRVLAEALSPAEAYGSLVLAAAPPASPAGRAVREAAAGLFARLGSGRAAEPAGAGEAALPAGAAPPGAAWIADGSGVLVFAPADAVVESLAGAVQLVRRAVDAAGDSADAAGDLAAAAFASASASASASSRTGPCLLPAVAAAAARRSHALRAEDAATGGVAGCPAGPADALAVVTAVLRPCPDETYYSTTGSHLTAVLRTGSGIPIALSCLLVEVGLRAGVPGLVCVGAPRQFLAAWSGEEAAAAVSRWEAILGDGEAAAAAGGEPVPPLRRLLRRLLPALGSGSVPWCRPARSPSDAASLSVLRPLLSARSAVTDTSLPPARTLLCAGRTVTPRAALALALSCGSTRGSLGDVARWVHLNAFESRSMRHEDARRWLMRVGAGRDGVAPSDTVVRVMGAETSAGCASRMLRNVIGVTQSAPAPFEGGMALPCVLRLWVALTGDAQLRLRQALWMAGLPAMATRLGGGSDAAAVEASLSAQGAWAGWQREGAHVIARVARAVGAMAEEEEEEGEEEEGRGGEGERAGAGGQGETAGSAAEQPAAAPASGHSARIAPLLARRIGRLWGGMERRLTWATTVPPSPPSAAAPSAAAPSASSDGPTASSSSAPSAAPPSPPAAPFDPLVGASGHHALSLLQRMGLRADALQSRPGFRPLQEDVDAKRQMREALRATSAGSARRHRAGVRFRHARHGYWGVVVAGDDECSMGAEWQVRMRVARLPRGPRQPFYRSLVDARAVGSAVETYVAEDNIVEAAGAGPGAAGARAEAGRLGVAAALALVGSESVVLPGEGPLHPSLGAMARLAAEGRPLTLCARLQVGEEDSDGPAA